MLMRHLLCGVVIGALAALASTLAGFLAWATVGFLVLGSNLGLGASASGALSSRLRGKARRTVAPSPPSMQAATLHPAK